METARPTAEAVRDAFSPSKRDDAVVRLPRDVGECFPPNPRSPLGLRASLTTGHSP